MTSNAAINKYAVEPLRMVDETSRLVGSYEDIVVALKLEKKQSKSDERLVETTHLKS